jgi:hypothetical protein
MLDLLLCPMQDHHPGILAALKWTLRNQLSRQNVIVVAKS